MARKTRSDCTVGTFEKKHDLPPGTLRNKDGRDTRSDKKQGPSEKNIKRKNKLLLTFLIKLLGIAYGVDGFNCQVFKNCLTKHFGTVIIPFATKQSGRQ